MMLASALCASIVVARWLGAEGLGALAVLNVTVAVALQLGSAGLPSANTYFIARDKTRLASVWSNALLFAILAGVTLALVVIGLAKIQPSLFGNVPLALIALAAATIPFQLISLLGLNVFLGLNRIAQFNTLDAAAQVLLLVNAVVALVIFSAGLRSLVALNVAASVLSCIVVVWMIARTVKETSGGWRFSPDAGLFKSMARYGIKFHIAVVAGMLIFRADLLIVNHFRGAKEAGVYAVASQVASMLMLLPGVIGTLLLPRIASEPDARGEMTMRVTRHTAFVMFLICLAAVPASFVLPLVYGQPFADATWLLLILLPGIFLVGIESVLVQHFSSLGLPVAIPIFWLITLVVNVTINLTFIPFFGARAAAVASSISYAMIFFLVVIYFRVQTGNRLSSTLLLRGSEMRDLVAMARR
jgi:O-antigen/teichoic acid export membrane protein